MTEKTLWKHIRTWAKTQTDVFVFKLVGSPRQQRGLPDVMGNVGAVSLYVELKTGTNMSPQQKVVAHNISSTGGNYAVVRTLEQFKNHVETLRNLNNSIDIAVCRL